MGKNITGLSPHTICKHGIARTFQVPRPFKNMSVLDNVVISGIYCGGKDKDESIKDAMDYIKFVGLYDKRDILARNLNLNEMKMLELAAALNTDPKIILIDEIISGLNPTETKHATDLILKLRDEMNITVFWIEHVMRAVMATAEKIFVLHHGRLIAEGAPEEISENEAVIRSYLGEKHI